VRKPFPTVRLINKARTRRREVNHQRRGGKVSRMDAMDHGFRGVEVRQTKSPWVEEDRGDFKRERKKT